ncbi:hypothetical protein J2I47_05690 [Fibrella sp. HMF5335]|uniref:Peptidase family M50 n=1 Tax=Fibrella rubiginis TaxID=2817060 RepID=A0A939GGI6_9BACT|nr:hypothetical protein [Fibrella rubiginis]MBO0936033.1 hypothetical protein [Fibrella rubiginis]
MTNNLYPFYSKLFFRLVLSFICFTILGTLLHETGHYVIAKYYGFDASIHYGSTHFNGTPEWFSQASDTIHKLDLKYQLYKKRGDLFHFGSTVNFQEKSYYSLLRQQQRKIMFPINLGGPAQTMITGTIGLAVLIARKRWWQDKQVLDLRTWFFIFLTLFWLRQSFNMIMSLYSLMQGKKWSVQMDETKLATYLQLWVPSISLMTGFVGFIVLGFITLKVVPETQRFTFILAGLVGGLFGFWLWMSWLGPIVLP